MSDTALIVIVVIGTQAASSAIFAIKMAFMIRAVRRESRKFREQAEGLRKRLSMKKFKMGLLTEQDGLFKLELMNPFRSFEGFSEEDVVEQAKAYCVEYYNHHPEEKIERRTIDFEVELPDD